MIHAGRRALRKLARWPGSRIALLWTVLIVVQGTCAWAIRVPDEPPRGERFTTPLELESIGAPPEPDSGPPRTRGIAPILDFVTGAVSPTYLILFSLFLVGMALVLYGPAVAMLVITASGSLRGGSTAAHAHDQGGHQGGGSATEPWTIASRNSRAHGELRRLPMMSYDSFNPEVLASTT